MEKLVARARTPREPVTGSVIASLFRQAEVSVRGLGLFLVLGGCVMSTRPPVLSPQSEEAGREPGMVTMPNVFDMPKDEAIAMLRSAGIAGDVTFDDNLCGSAVDHRVIELGRICYQHPATNAVQGARLPVLLRVQTENPWRGDVGLSNEWRLMPDLVGTPIQAARARMRDVGFAIDVAIDLVWVDEPACAPLVVCRTIPNPLERTGVSSTKVIYVGRDPNDRSGDRSHDDLQQRSPTTP